MARQQKVNHTNRTLKTEEWGGKASKALQITYGIVCALLCAEPRELACLKSAPARLALHDEPPALVELRGGDCCGVRFDDVEGDVPRKSLISPTLEN